MKPRIYLAACFVASVIALALAAQQPTKISLRKQVSDSLFSNGGGPPGVISPILGVSITIKLTGGDGNECSLTIFQGVVVATTCPTN